MTVTVEMTYGVTISEEIQHTHENKISVESSVRKSWVAVAQKEMKKQVMYGAQAAQKELDGLAAGASRKRRTLQETGKGVLEGLSSDSASNSVGGSLADLLSKTEETFKEFKHTHKHS